MRKARFNLASLMLWTTAAPAWFYVAIVLQHRHVIASLSPFFVIPVLAGITCAVRRLLRWNPNSWGLSAIVAPALVAVAAGMKGAAEVLLVVSVLSFIVAIVTYSIVGPWYDFKRRPRRIRRPAAAEDPPPSPVGREDI